MQETRDQPAFRHGCAIDARRATAHPGCDTVALIRFVETRFHAAHRRELPDFIRLAWQVALAHKLHPAAPLGLAALRQRVAWDLEAQMQNDEAGLFPAMRRGEHPASAAVDLMPNVRADYAVKLKEVFALTGGLALPAGTCPARRTVDAGAGTFTEDVAKNIRVENDVLVPSFAAELAAAAGGSADCEGLTPA